MGRAVRNSRGKTMKLSSYIESPFSAIRKGSIDRVGETNPCWKHGEGHRKSEEVGEIQESFVFGLSVDWGYGEKVDFLDAEIVFNHPNNYLWAKKLVGWILYMNLLKQLVYTDCRAGLYGCGMLVLFRPFPNQ